MPGETREYKMTIDPKILRLLGPNLYTNIYYVLAELISNAYDADASNVYIIQGSNCIIVEDDGIGMDYRHGVKKYLNVAEETRKTEEEAYTSKGRRRMGRKGVGKLSALSVSERVLVKTKVEGEHSGFVLSREIGKDGILEGLQEDQIIFSKVTGVHGTAVVMENPRYSLNKTATSIKKNLLKIFPLVSENFRIHIIPESGEELIIDNFDKEMISQLGGLITLGDEYAELSGFFNNEFPEKTDKPLMNALAARTERLILKNKNGDEKEYEIKIVGWIGAYSSTRDRKTTYEDFPDNFLSLFANKKLGEYNILPVVGKNRLIEVYVVGQLHVDLFEETELPDMALSNRQGYKNDDPRYEFVINYVRNQLLEQIVDIRKLYADYKKEGKEKVKLLQQKENEKDLREKVDDFRRQVAVKSAEKIIENMPMGDSDTFENIKAIVEHETNTLLPIVGLKRIIDAEKRKILISHTEADKDLCDIVYNMLQFNNVPPEDIIYTHCENELSRIPDEEGIFDYLRSFFVESYSKQGIFAIFVTSQEMHNSWGAVIEAGAGWLIKVDHKIFNIHGYRPQSPLDVETSWHTTIRRNELLVMSDVEVDRFAVKLEAICDRFGYAKRSRVENVSRIKSYIVVEN